ncbi:type IV pilus assembly protein PilV [Inhella inkyongensis]|uniref:Type IV pilus assembly protein PilV n=1 Tax=Inhella inkyongensis TaxID=392593 RepID=A0A840S045_9BURK|nr:hypothetical protein [Inhella inkyongensis]MBB5203615.1 type IV pilus assembly protein PilV [Inhella inkyongensis]
MHPRSQRLRGATMIEILITLVITAFGLLGLAGFVTRSTTLSVDAGQKARAASLVDDMASRLANNKAKADDYVTDQVYGETATAVCTGAVGSAALDLCQWGNLLVGTQDARTGGNAAALGFRGCVTKPSATDPAYVITVAYGSMASGFPPADLCGKGAFGDESYRRVVRAQVRVAALTK